MTTRHTLRMIGVASVALAALAWLPTAHAQGSCGCEDVKNIRARLCAARAAIGEWDRLIRDTHARERTNKQVEMFSQAGYAEVSHCVDEIVDIYFRESASKSNPWEPATQPVRSAGGTDPHSCNASVKQAPSKCLEENIMAHESLHKQRCESKTRDWDFLDKLSLTKDYRGQGSLIDYMDEEATGYMIEVNHLAATLQQLSTRCPQQMFMLQTKRGMVFSVEQCPKFDLTLWKRTCKRM